jgi:hypothetical protein
MLCLIALKSGIHDRLKRKGGEMGVPNRFHRIWTGGDLAKKPKLYIVITVGAD